MKFNCLWSLYLETSPEAADAFADALGDAPLALTVLAPPRNKKARIEALFGEKPDRAELTSRLSVAAALKGIRLPIFHIREIADLDWLKKVAGDFPPLPVAHWIIHGAQYRKAVSDRRHALQIDAANAFGTGEHPTTRGCLLMLEWVFKKNHRHPREGGGPSPSLSIRRWMAAGVYPMPRHGAGMTLKESRTKLLDMGCGSGILAMAFAKTHRGRAMAVDNDPDSVRIAQENVHINGLGGKIRAARSFGYQGTVRRNGPYDLIMANIFARPLAQMAKDLRRNLRPGGTAILSGLLASQANLVLAAHRMQGVYPVRIFRIGEWAVLVLRRKR